MGHLGLNKTLKNGRLLLPYTVFYCVQYTLFYIENDAEIFPVHCTWKVAEKGFTMAFMMNKLAIIISCEIILEKKIIFAKNHSGVHYTCMCIILNKIQ